MKTKPKSITSQRTTIYKHLLKGRKISQMSALELYGCGRLAARIKEIRDILDGTEYAIKTEMVAFTKKSGKVGKYGVYSLIKR